MESTHRAYANVLTLLLFISLATICTATAQTCAILNGSFEDDGLINDIAVQEPNAWTVDIASGKFVGYIYTAWRTDGFYGLTLYSKKRVQLFAGDTVTVSQQMDLAAVSEITFDVKLDTAFGAWDPAVCSAVLLINGDVVWRSNSVGSDVRGVYLGQVYAVEDKYRTAALHTLSLGMRMNVDSYFWTDGLYMTQWDNISVVCAPPHPLRPVIYVDADVNGANNGSSWKDAYNHLQDALADANSATRANVIASERSERGNLKTIIEIRVAQGTYRPDEDTLHPAGTGDRTAAFQLINGVTIKGGYAGPRMSLSGADPNARDITLYQTILSGDIGTPEDKTDNCYHIFYHPEGLNLDDTAVLDGFIITAGNANGADLDSYGGGMYNFYSSPTVNNCTFSGNSADIGGGMYNLGGTPTLSNCRFSGNSADIGGGMDNFYSSPTVNNCTFSGNSADIGGGMDNYYNSPTVTKCSFSGNSADLAAGMSNWQYSSPTVNNCTFSANSAGAGGGICNYWHSRPTVNNCTFSGNSAEEGGGMDNYESSPTVNNCTFSENSAGVGGGMCTWQYSSPTVTDCTFSENSADYGGGMCNDYRSSPSVDNCTFSGNSAGAGGGMHNSVYSEPNVNNCTFSGNSANYGGGMCNDYESSATLTNCTIADNNAPNGPAMACDSYERSYPSNVTMLNCIIWNGSDWLWNNDQSSITITYTDLQGGWPGVGNIDGDPCFVDDFHLGPDSPCINAGDPSYVPGPNETDIDGEARVMWERVDMGADEFNPIRFVEPTRTRISRTEFVYDCNVSFTNLWPFAIENVQLEMLSAPDNMDINDPNVSFGDIEFSPRESITSIDTCTFKVDRSQAIDPDEISWRVSCTRADTGMPIELTIGGVGSAAVESMAGEQGDFEGLAGLADNWLWVGTPGGIDQDIVQDGSVNLADFAEFAGRWRGSEK